MATFRNPANGYEESYSVAGSFFGALLLGPIYFAIKGAWGYAIGCLVVAIMTAWFGVILFALAAPEAIRKTYLRKGWVSDDAPLKVMALHKRIGLYLLALVACIIGAVVIGQWTHIKYKLGI